MKTVWCFGDSWTWGSELWDETICSEHEAQQRYGFDFTLKCKENHSYVYGHRWSGILNRHSILNVLNFGEPGCSNEAIVEIINHTINTLQYYPDYSIISWTSQSRETTRKKDWKDIDNPSFRFISEQSTLTDDEQEAKFLTEVCAANFLLSKSKVINIDAFHTNKTHYPLPDFIYYKKETLLGIATEYKFPEITSYTKELHWNYSEKNIKSVNLKGNGHPDENGHKLIANYFLKELL